MRIIRIGQVSQIDYETGMIRVTYKDMDEAVSAPLPYACLDGEYHMPNVEDYVLVLHLTNGQEAGVILGRYWNKKHKPPVYGKDRYRKDFSNDVGKAFLERNPDGQKATLHFDLPLTIGSDGAVRLESGQSITIDASNIILSCSAGTTTVAAIIQHMRSYHE